MNAIEEWRKSRGYTYADMASLIGCSRQYAHKLCKEGARTAAKIIKLVIIAQDEIKLEDFLNREEKNALYKLGYLDSVSVRDTQGDSGIQDSDLIV